MIKVTVELCPHGFELGKKNILSGIVWNDATGTIASGNYKYTFTNSKNMIFNGEVKNFTRARSVQDLLRIIFEEISKKEKNVIPKSGGSVV